MRKRIVSGVVFVPLFVLLVWYGPFVGFVLLVAAVVALGQWELYRMVERARPGAYRELGILLGLLITAGFALFALGRQEFLPLAVTAAVVLPALTGMAGRHMPVAASTKVVWTIFGVAYVAWLLGHAVLLRALPAGDRWVFFLVLVTWAGDTAAMLTGRAFGRHQMAPVLSPNKTWEGALGGLLASILAALVAQLWFHRGLPPGQALALGGLLGVVGQGGDLSMSLLKRAAQAKDTGGVIPGHGGVLDRVDSLLFNAPVLYYFVRIFLVGAT